MRHGPVSIQHLYSTVECCIAIQLYSSSTVYTLYTTGSGPRDTLRATDRGDASLFSWSFCGRPHMLESALCCSSGTRAGCIWPCIMKSTLTQKGDLRRSNGTGTVGRGERSAPGLRFMLRLYLSRPRRVFGRRAVVRVCSWVWMVVRFVCVIRVPVCACVSRVCQKSHTDTHSHSHKHFTHQGGSRTGAV